MPIATGTASTSANDGAQHRDDQQVTDAEPQVLRVSGGELRAGQEVDVVCARSDGIAWTSRNTAISTMQHDDQHPTAVTIPRTRCRRRCRLLRPATS